MILTAVSDFLTSLVAQIAAGVTLGVILGCFFVGAVSALAGEGRKDFGGVVLVLVLLALVSLFVVAVAVANLPTA